MQITFRIDDRQIERAFGEFERRQLPFALALTATNLARGVQAAERAELESTFDKPTPFTLNSVAVRAATKANLTATVYVRDIAAAYLAPYVDGGSGMQVLGTKKAILAPRDIGLNAYGNLPKGKLAALKGRPDVFVGSVKLKDGRTVNGVWQRPSASPVAGKKRMKGSKLANTSGRLKLLIQFEDPKPVKQRLHFRERALIYVRKNAAPAFSRAFAQAVATAR